MPRTIAIGDVHGCSQELQDLLNKLDIKPEDHIIFLGDLINRGPDTRGVLDIVHNLPNASFVMGNHELRFLRYHQDGDASKLKKYDHATLEVLTEKDWKLLESMEKTIYLPEYETVCVHGGFLPNKPWDRQPIDVVARIQVVDEKGNPHKRSKSPNSPLWSDLWHGPPFVVYGHLPEAKVEKGAWSLGIDTACVWGYSLTAYVLPSKEIVQVPARKAYITSPKRKF